jgi:hypothetical protein
MDGMLTPKQLAEMAAKAKAEKEAAELALATRIDPAVEKYITAEFDKAVASIPALLEKAAGEGKNEVVVYAWEVVGYSAHSKEHGVVGERLKAHLEEQGFTVQKRDFEKKAVTIDRMHQWAELIASW